MSTDHVKLTREQRAAAGWVLCWGLYDWNDRTWLTTGGGWRQLRPKAERIGMRLSRRDTYERDDANRYALHASGGVAARPFWRRKKPKPTKPTGEAIVRVTVLHGVAGGCQVRATKGSVFFVDAEEIEGDR